MASIRSSGSCARCASSSWRKKTSSSGSRSSNRSAMSDTYILKGHEPVKCDDLMWWAWWFETADRQVRDTACDDVRVSPIFLAVDHGFGGRKELFETRVFGNGFVAACGRDCPWATAEE